MIHVENLTKTFHVSKRSSGVKMALRALVRRESEVIEAVKDLSFHVAPGEMVGYIGPNGAGKSTTIKIMSGILVPDSGRCEILGRVPWKERVAHVRNIGVVFGQRTQLWWDVPVQDSFLLLRDIYQVPEADFRRNSERLTAVLQLDDLLQKPVRSLSLGQRMRCELAASLLHRPQILFLDEPTIGLDAVAKLAVRKFIRDLNREEGTTVILTTHDMNDIEALTDRILLIGKGRLLYDGGLADLRDRYDTIRTVTVNFREDQEPPVIAGAVCDLLATGRARYRVNTADVPVSAVIARLSGELALQDVFIDAQPVEELIVQLYQEHRI